MRLCHPRVVGVLQCCCLLWGVCCAPLSGRDLCLLGARPSPCARVWSLCVSVGRRWSNGSPSQIGRFSQSESGERRGGRSPTASAASAAARQRTAIVVAPRRQLQNRISKSARGKKIIDTEEHPTDPYTVVAPTPPHRASDASRGVEGRRRRRCRGARRSQRQRSRRPTTQLRCDDDHGRRRTSSRHRLRGCRRPPSRPRR